MARKVFISFLGTNKYIETYYQLGDKITQKPVRFIQEALLRMNFDKWDEEDKVFIFYTELSYQVNWLDNGQKYAITTVEKTGLNSVLLSLKEDGFKPSVKSILILDGFSEKDIWSIFNSVYDVLEESDEIFFDMTHAFRSIPFFSFALFNYAAFLKNTRLVSVFYGAFEKLGTAREVNEMPMKERIAPILDLKNIIELQQLVIAANNYKEFGKMGKLSLSLNQAAETLSAESKADRRRNDAIGTLNKSIEEFEKRITTCRGNSLIKGDAVMKIREKIQVVINSGVPQPIVELLKSIKSIVNKFSVNSQENIYAAIDWCLNYGMIQQAYTLGQELIITVICSKLAEYNPYLSEEKLDQKKRYRNFRDYISAILAIREDKIANEISWTGGLLTYRRLTKAMFALPWIRAIRPDYAKLTTNRNQINHAGFTGTVTADSIIGQLKEPLSKCLAIVKQELELPVIQTTDEEVLINLSNHPYEKWSVAQKEAAAVFGNCIDLPFPVVDAEADKEVIEALTNEYCQRVLQLSQGKGLVVHLMGEMTLTFALVKQFQKIGICCIASTSERIVNEHNAGYKEVLFEFKRFREYQ